MTKAMEGEVVPGLVSVIIPVFNRTEMLREAVACVEAQVYRPLEIILVDDGSTDGTGGFCDELARNSPDMVRAIHRPNGGPGAARESGRRAARGEFVQYLDSDDWLDPRKLELQVAALRRDAAADLAYCASQVRHLAAGPDARPRVETTGPLKAIFPRFLSGRLWRTMTPLYRREFSDRMGPWTDLRQEEDLEYDARAGALGARLVYCDEVLAENRHHLGARAGGASQIDERRMRARCESHRMVYAHARAAGVDPSSPDMQRYARELFHLARLSGAAGFVGESRELFRLAREASGPRRAAGPDFLFYRAAAAVSGWRSAGRLAGAVESLRARMAKGSD